MDDIARALYDMRELTAVEGARALLNALGYKSERWGALDGSDEIADVRELALAFQFGEPELDREMDVRLWDGGQASRYRSLIFLSVELEGGKQDKRAHKRLTKRISGLFSNPSMIVFRRSDGGVTFGIGKRRPDKNDCERDAIYGESLMGCFRALTETSGGLETLRSFSLSERLRWMRENNAPRNFDGLYAAWLDVMSADIFVSARSRRSAGIWRRGVRAKSGCSDGESEEAVTLPLF